MVIHGLYVETVIFMYNGLHVKRFSCVNRHAVRHTLYIIQYDSYSFDVYPLDGSTPQRNDPNHFAGFTAADLDYGQEVADCKRRIFRFYGELY